MNLSIGIKALGEYIGTLILVYVIIVYKNPILAGITLALIIYCLSENKNLSGGHVNPVVTIGKRINSEINNFHTIIYILAQIAGGITAIIIYKNM